MWLYLGWRISMFLSERLPLRALTWMAQRVADVAYALDRRGRRAVRDNLSKMLPDCPRARVRSLAREAFRDHARCLVEFFRFRRFSDRFLERKFAIRPREILDDALAQGRGVIIVSAHISNWELGGGGMARLGYPLAAVAQTHPNRRVDALFQRQRRKIGMAVLQLETAAMGAHRSLKRNRVVCLLGDRDVRGTGVRVEFFGRKTSFPQGPARLALAHKCPLLVGYVLREPDDRYVLSLKTLTAPEGSRDDKVRQLVQAWADIFEDVLRRAPSQWSNFYKQWPEEAGRKNDE